MTQRTTRAERLAMPLARERGTRPGHHAWRLRPPGPTAPYRPPDRPGRTGARPLRAHPRRGLPVLRRTSQDPAGGAVPRGLAPRP